MTFSTKDYGAVIWGTKIELIHELNGYKRFCQNNKPPERVNGTMHINITQAGVIYNSIYNQYYKLHEEHGLYEIEYSFTDPSFGLFVNLKERLEKNYGEPLSGYGNMPWVSASWLIQNEKTRINYQELYEQNKCYIYFSSAELSDLVKTN